MKRYGQYIIYIAVFGALTLSLYLLMVLSATVPNDAIWANMFRSAQTYIHTDRYQFTEDGRFQNVADNHADQMWLNVAWNMDGDSPFVSALDTGYYDGEHYGLPMGFYLSVTRGSEANADYTRYWHGTAGILRMLHLVTDIQGIRTLGTLCLAFLILRTVWILLNGIHWELGLCLLASLFFVQGWNLGLSVEYLPTFLICFALCPAFLRLERKGDFPVKLLSVISGCLTAFFDFLTTETVTILIPLILVLAIRSRERRLGSPRSTTVFLLSCLLCWGFAYLGAFLVKWAAVSLATGENHFLAAMNSVDLRVSGTVIDEQTRKRPGMAMAIIANLSALFEGTSRADYRLVVTGLAITALVLVILVRMNHVRDSFHPGTIFLLLLGSIVPVRYSVLANHSFLHAFFTYRALASTILAILAALVVNLRPLNPKGGR